MSYDLLAHGLSSLVSEVQIAAPGDQRIAELNGNVKSFDLDSLHDKTLQWYTAKGDIEHPSANLPGFQVHVGLEDLRKVTYGGFSSSTKIRKLFSMVQKLGWIPDEKKYDMRLTFDACRLDMNKTFGDYKIEHGDCFELYLSRSGGGGPGAPMTMKLDPKFLDPSFDFDFTKMTDDGNMFTRGGATYKRPYGWKRFALNVSKRYGDSTWLGGIAGTKRTRSHHGEWPVSYHGTGLGFAESIAKEGFKLDKCHRFRFGKGIYSTSDPEIAEKYAQNFIHKGKKYKILVQNRVNMEETLHIKKYNYFVTASEDNIRPYGILIKEVKE